MADPTNYQKIINHFNLLVHEAIIPFADELMTAIENVLVKNIDLAKSNKQLTVAVDGSNLFIKSKTIIEDHFRQNINKGIKQFRTNELDTQVRENDFHKEAWSLIDVDVLEETINIRSLSSEANQAYRETLWQLEQRLAFINRGIPINESNNPLSPLQFFSALRFGLKSLAIDAAEKNTCHKILSIVIDKKYPDLLATVNGFLIEEGILPDLDYTKQHKPIGVNNRSPEAPSTSREDVDQKTVINEEGTHSQPQDEAVSESSSTTEKNQPLPEKASPGSSQIPVVNTIRQLLKRARNIRNEEVAIPIATNKANRTRNDLSHQENTVGENIGCENTDHETDQNNTAPTPNEGSLNNNIVFNNAAIAEAVELVQQSAATSKFNESDTKNQILTTPTNIAKNSADVYQELTKESPSGSISAKNMYTIDMVGMLFEYILADENLPDSIKTLLSHLHTPFLKLAFTDERFFDDKEHKSRILLDSLADAGTNFVSHDGVSQYNMYEEIKKVVQRVIKEFKSDVDLFSELLIAFNLLKKRITHTHNLRARSSIEKKRGQEKHALAKTSARQEIKRRIEGQRVPSALINLLSPWFVYLTFLQLKDDDGSKKLIESLAIIDNIITYCSIKKAQGNTDQLENKFNDIIQQVKIGLTDIAYNPAKTTSVITGLEQLKTDIINKQYIKTTLTKHDTVAATNDEKNTQNVIPNTPTPEEERVMNYIKLIEPGTWVEYDKTERMKISGFSADTLTYILINQSSQEVTMLSRVELARDILSEKATVLDGTAKPLFDRALERIKQNLDKQMQLSDSMV